MEKNITVLCLVATGKGKMHTNNIVLHLALYTLDKKHKFKTIDFNFNLYLNIGVIYYNPTIAFNR